MNSLKVWLPKVTLVSKTDPKSVAVNGDVLLIDDRAVDLSRRFSESEMGFGKLAARVAGARTPANRRINECMLQAREWIETSSPKQGSLNEYDIDDRPAERRGVVYLI